MKIDHVEPVVPLNRARRDMTWDEVVDRMFNCLDDNLQALCDKCHKIKTQKIENPERRKFKLEIKEYLKEYQGNMYNKLLVLDHHSYSKAGYGRALCECECGNQVIVQYNNLKSGHTKSCGCIKGRHKKSNTKIYKTWKNIKSRCTNPKATGYRYYGGRGIQICDEWFDSFDAFYSDIGDPPNTKSTVERIDFDSDYEIGNCKWATYKEQANNRSNNHILTYDGESKTIQQWAEYLGIKPNTITYRIIRGWSIPQALEFEQR